MRFLMISCKIATELVDKRQAVGLSFPEQLKLRLHTAMCDACKLYEKQSAKIEDFLSGELGKTPDSGKVTDKRASRLAERILSEKK